MLALAVYGVVPSHRETRLGNEIAPGVVRYHCFRAGMRSTFKIWLDAIAKGKLSRNTLKHIKGVVSGIFPDKVIQAILSFERDHHHGVLRQELC
jgi:hypothetical protein